MSTVITPCYSKTDEGWWRSASIYQIYPASFCSAKGGEKGDLEGILSKLDYIKSLGVDAVWLSPHYESPNYDMGYDISNYQKPDPAYGTLEDCQALIDGCHARGLKILFDLVINHTSHLHSWFLESRKSKDNPFRKFYIWRPPRYDADGTRRPPTNWRSVFLGSAWTFDELTDEYYLAIFTPYQPDLDWELAEVREAIYKETILFWLDRGLDGFRVDTAAKYSKHPFVDMPVTDSHTYEQLAHTKHTLGPRLFEFLDEMSAKAMRPYGAVTIGELGGPGENAQKILEFVGGGEKRRFNMMITFGQFRLDRDGTYSHYPKKMVLSDLKKVTADMQTLSSPGLQGWLCNYLENHDQPRCISRWCDDSPEHRAAGSKMLAIFLTTLSGTLLLYQGQEIGSINLPSSTPVGEYIDILSQDFWGVINKAAVDYPETYKVGEARRGISKLARDHARVPIAWDSSKNGGFSSGIKTWMLVNESYKELNVAEQECNPASVLHFWRKVLLLRKAHRDTFVFGRFDLIDAQNEQTFCYTKTSQDGKSKIFVVLNWTGEEQAFSLPDGRKARLILSGVNDPVTQIGQDGLCRLLPWEGRVYEIA